MRTLSRTLLLLGAVAIILAALPDRAGAQGFKLGYINDEKIKLEYRAWERAQDQWEIEKKAWDDEALSKEQELAELIDEYDKQKLILSEEKKKEREDTILKKRDALDAFTRQVYGPGGTAEKKQMDLIGPLLDNINKAIEQVAIDGNYDLILTMQSGIGFVKETYDVTDKVLEALEQIE